MTVDRAYLAAEAAKNSHWYEKPMRYGNLTWVEPDPVQYDIDWWIDFCKRTHTDVVTLSVGGIVAYYPTQIPLHYRSPWLGDRDLVGEFITRCRQEGIYVIARIDPHAFRDDMAKAHPEWVFVNQDGTPRRHWDNKELWVACTHGGYTHEYLTGVIREIMTLYMPDAIFSNRYTGSGICYCETCRRMFREETGFCPKMALNLRPSRPMDHMGSNRAARPWRSMLMRSARRPTSRRFIMLMTSPPTLGLKMALGLIFLTSASQ